MNTPPASDYTVGLSPRAEKIIRIVSVWTVLGLAISAAILSFAGLQELAIEAGMSASIAWLLPVIIDGLVLTGSLGVISSSLAGASTWYPWTLTIIGVVASVAGNVAVALPNLSSRLVHSAGPIVFALSIEGLLRIYRSSAVATAAKDRAKMIKEEADIDKQIRKEEREERKAVRLHEASLLQTTPVVASTITPTIVRENNVIIKNGESVKKRITDLVLIHPQISGAEVARQLNIDGSYARKIIREIHKEMSTTVVPIETVVVESAVIEPVVVESALVEPVVAVEPVTAIVTESIEEPTIDLEEDFQTPKE